MVAFSLIIPAFNEAALLPRLLESIRVARGRFTRGEIEVIVADNASTDETARIARESGCIVVDVVERKIACARNGGAARARSGILGFVDADSVLHPETFNSIHEAMSGPGIVGGATGVRFDRSSPGIDLTVALVRPMVHLMGLDGGVVFCFARDFRDLGGYPESERIAEDVNFLLKLKRLGKTRGQRFRILEGVTTITSSRKFDQHGDWHFLLTVPKIIAARLFSRRGFDEHVNNYWYRR